LMGAMVELSRSVEGILFKNFTEIGDVWTHVIFEDTPSTAGVYTLLYSGLLALFIWLCWWLVNKGIVQPIRRIVVSLLGILVVFVTMLMYAYMGGAVATVKDFPVVTFSNQTQLVGEHAVPVLLAQDDKMFAFLVVITGATPADGVHKMVMYLPRSEVKYMAVIRLFPLYRLDKYDDLMKLEEESKRKTQ